MPYVTDVDDVRFMLEVYECECGYHIGLDVSYADQVGEVTVECPSCKLPITSHIRMDEREHVGEIINYGCWYLVYHLTGGNHAHIFSVRR